MTRSGANGLGKAGGSRAKPGGFEPLSAPARDFDDSSEAGDYDRAGVYAKFLHRNATSHKWVFGAIAQLIDNAVDEICNGATYVKVDKIINSKDNSPMLVFQDDGGGMDPEGVRRCLSLEFSTKKSKTTTGQYGNGFKTSTMRLGADAIVFTRSFLESDVTLSVGLLSRTFLRKSVKDDIVVPMLNFQDCDGQIVPLLHGSQGDWDGSLKIILDWSPFSSQEELLQQFEDIHSHGTKVLIYNLWMNDDGLSELDFDDDGEDILLRDHTISSGELPKIGKERTQQPMSQRIKFSLRAYTSILYLKKHANFEIILRGKPIEHTSVANDLKFKKVYTYTPRVDGVPVTVETGFPRESPLLGSFGMNIYHKNRLIMPFWKILQEDSARGMSVVGVLEANFIEPEHGKQDFKRTPLFTLLRNKLRKIITDYWKNSCHLIGFQPSDPELKSQYDAVKKDSGGPGPNCKLKSSTHQRTGEHLLNLLPEKYDDAAVVGLTDNGAAKVEFHELVPIGAEETKPFKVPLCNYKKLKPHQRDGLEWLWKMYCSNISGGIVADDMGLGKTLQMTTFLSGLFCPNLISRVMIIAPVSIVSAWTKELTEVGLDQWVYIYETSDAKLDSLLKEKIILLTTYEVFCKKHEILGSPSQNWDYVVLDEAHRIKNLEAKVTKTMNDIRCMKKVLLTGTPLCRDLEDIFALLQFIEPEVLGDVATFRRKFMLPIVNGQYVNSIEKNKLKYLRALMRCRKLILPYILRRNKSVLVESGELPGKKHDVVVWLKLTDLQIKLYKNLYELYGSGKVKPNDDINNKRTFALSMLSQLISIDPCLLIMMRDKERKENKDTPAKEMAIKLLSYTGVNEDSYRVVESSCKTHFVLDLIDDMLIEDRKKAINDKKKAINDKRKCENKVKRLKILVFSQYLDVLDILEECLRAKMKEGDLLRIDGTMSRKQRDKKVEEFTSGEGPTIFLLSAKVGGEGLTLTSATRLIIVDPSHNISDDNQISDRVYRLGQENDVIIYRLFTCSTVEEHMYKVQLLKGTLAQAIVEGNVCASLVRKEEGNVLVLPESFENSKTYDLLLRELGDTLELDPKHHRFLRKHHLVKGIMNQNSVFSEGEALPDINTDDSSEDETTVEKEKHKLHNKQPGVIERFMEIASDKVGLLCGKEPSTLTEISRRSAAYLSIMPQEKDRRQDPYRQVLMIGTGDEIEKAKRLIRAVMNSADHHYKKDVRAADKKVLLVPRELVGYIIGKGGKRVTEMENQSGASITNISNKSEGKIEVTGNMKEIQIAESLILDTINNKAQEQSLPAGSSPRGAKESMLPPHDTSQPQSALLRPTSGYPLPANNNTPGFLPAGVAHGNNSPGAKESMFPPHDTLQPQSALFRPTSGYPLHANNNNTPGFLPAGAACGTNSSHGVEESIHPPHRTFQPRSAIFLPTYGYPLPANRNNTASFARVMTGQSYETPRPPVGWEAQPDYDTQQQLYPDSSWHEGQRRPALFPPPSGYPPPANSTHEIHRPPLQGTYQQHHLGSTGQSDYVVQQPRYLGQPWNEGRPSGPPGYPPQQPPGYPPQQPPGYPPQQPPGYPPQQPPGYPPQQPPGYPPQQPRFRGGVWPPPYR